MEKINKCYYIACEMFLDNYHDLVYDNLALVQKIADFPMYFGNSSEYSNFITKDSTQSANATIKGNENGTYN